MDVNVIFTDMHAHTAACEKAETTTTSAENAFKDVGTTIPSNNNNNGNEIAGESVKSGAVAVKEDEKEEKKYDAVVDLLGGQ